ncbi:MAG: DEAD/DEAH box helicase family protein [Desulfurobacteriaceae bacterium]
MNTSENDLVKEFFIPLLKNSIEYKRGVGFFSSGWFKVVSEGIINLVLNGGRIRLITSPILSKEDYEALIKGTQAARDRKLYEAILFSIKDLKESLEEDTLSAIAWMIADGIMEIKLAVPRNNLTGDFHDKFGIFIDSEGNKVAFSGSPNESIQGMHNYESIKIFPSWRDLTSKEIAEAEDCRFELLWNDKDPNLKVFSIPEAARKEILKLRTKKRPYKKEVILSAFKENNLPVLRNYQKEAVSKWVSNNFQGIFEMATGTGKTFTSLFAINEFIKHSKRNLIVIIVPFVHLIDQWEKNVKLLFKDPIKCCGSKNKWLSVLRDKILIQNKGDIENLVVISTIQTAIKDYFLEVIRKASGNSLIVIDEVHYAGAPEFSKILDPFFKARIGLSATPVRMWDEIGTEKLEEYFGGVVYRFPLGRAIQEGFLTPYEYHPILVELTEEEFEEYQLYSEKIAKLLARESLSEEEKSKRLEHILISRANLLNRAKNKLKALEKLIVQNRLIKYSIFYCDPLQIEEVSSILRKYNIVISKFTAKETKEQLKKQKKKES